MQARILLLHADQLVWEWFEWSRRWRPHLGTPRVVPYCRQSRTSRQYDEFASYDDVFTVEMQAVERCVEKLSMVHQQAIVFEMRKRGPQDSIDASFVSDTYLDSLNTILPLLLKEELMSVASI
jgi:hypothetical protein